jgi:hypothetical protein
MGQARHMLVQECTAYKHEWVYQMCKGACMGLSHVTDTKALCACGTCASLLKLCAAVTTSSAAWCSEVGAAVGLWAP